jgi:hypothetical protein
MAKNTVTIAGEAYEVACNMNALMDFLSERGTDDFTALTDLTKLKPSDMLPLMAACIREGERLAGRDCSITGKDIGTVADFSVITSFMEIFGRAMSPAVTAEEKK